MSVWFPRASLASLTVCLAILNGCAPESAPPQNATSNGPELVAPNKEPPQGNSEPPLADVADAVDSIPSAGRTEAAAEPIRVAVVSPEEYQAVIDKHKGKVVLVDFWATWCVPCRRIFPHTVEMHHQFAKQGFTAVSMALDDPENKSDVLGFLTVQKAQFDNLLCGLGGGEESFAAYKIDNSSLPHYKLYDRQGQLRQTFSVDPDAGKSIDPQEIDAAVTRLLEEPAE